MPAIPISFAVGDRITLKKPHPCGGREWSVYRIGADIGLRCLTCDHRVMLPRSEVQRRLVTRVQGAQPVDTGDQGGATPSGNVAG